MSRRIDAPEPTRREVFKALNPFSGLKANNTASPDETTPAVQTSHLGEDGLVSRRSVVGYGVVAAGGAALYEAGRRYFRKRPVIRNRTEGQLRKEGVVLEDLRDLGNLELKEAEFSGSFGLVITPEVDVPVFGRWKVSPILAGETKHFTARGIVQAKINFEEIEVIRDGNSVQLILPDVFLGDARVDDIGEGHPRLGLGDQVWNQLTGNERDRIRSGLMIPFATVEFLREAMRTQPAPGWKPTRPDQVMPGEFINSARSHALNILRAFEEKHGFTDIDVRFRNQGRPPEIVQDIKALPKDLVVKERLAGQDTQSRATHRVDEVLSRIKPKTDQERAQMAQSAGK